MNFRTFIEAKYDVRERIDRLRSNPIKEFIDSDIFPCDFIDVEAGELIKKLYYADGKRDIAVLDLLAYRREDLVRLGDKDLLELYDNYVQNFTFEGFSLDDPVNLQKIREESLRHKGLIVK